MQQQSVEAQTSNTGLKHFIIGKVWAQNRAGTRPGVIRINRDLPTDVVLKPGTVIFLNTNAKREGKMDADFSASILLPEVIANDLIQKERDQVAVRKSQA